MPGPLLALLCIFITAQAPWPLLGEETRPKIVVAGAPSLAPFAERYAAAYRANHPEVEIQILGGGSNYAVEAVRLGKIDVGLVTRALNRAEKAAFYARVIGHDAIIMLSHPRNMVSGLLLEQIRSIYRGNITNWRDIGGAEKGIVPLSRERGSALRTIFLERVFGKGFNGQEKAFSIRASKEKILRTIKRVEGSLGYGFVRLDEAEEQGVTVLRVEGALPTGENIRAGSYPLVRPHFIIAKAKPPGLVREWMAGFAAFAGRAESRGER